MKPWRLLAFVTVALALLVLVAAQPVMAQTNAGKDRVVALALAADTGPALTLAPLTLKQAAPASAPAPATPSKWSIIVAASPNNGATFGAGVQCQFTPIIAGCVFGKADAQSHLDGCIGVTTSLSTIGDLFVKELTGVTITQNPSATQVGVARAVVEKEWIAVITRAF